MPKTVFSVDLKDPEVHHPEPDCSIRIGIVQRGNDREVEWPDPEQPLHSLDDPDDPVLRFFDEENGRIRSLPRCSNCRDIREANSCESGD